MYREVFELLFFLLVCIVFMVVRFQYSCLFFSFHFLRVFAVLCVL